MFGGGRPSTTPPCTALAGWVEAVGSLALRRTPDSRVIRLEQSGPRTSLRENTLFILGFWIPNENLKTFLAYVPSGKVHIKINVAVLEKLSEHPGVQTTCTK